MTVTYIIFNRPDAVKESFERIRQAKPEKLYVVSDAAKPGDTENAEKVKRCREYVEAAVDWGCEFHKIYAESNMGCRDRVSSGISEVLEKEEDTIILEDDILPAPVFFEYCTELLDHYRYDPKVMMISGCNLLKEAPVETPYTFSCFASIWGWATWARAWEHYDVKVADWPEVKASGKLKRVMRGFPYEVFKREIDSVYTGVKDTWDIQWDYCRDINRGLGIVPRENLISNIGFGADATHTTWEATEDFTYGKMTLPFSEHPPVKRDTVYDAAYIRKNYGSGRVKRFIKKRLGGILQKG